MMITRTVHNRSVQFAVGYSSRMLKDPEAIALELSASAKEAGIKFDTIVGRGSSGALIIPIVAHLLRKKWLIVRKPAEIRNSHACEAKWIGELGQRWIFLDDFCSSGATFRAVRDGVKEAVEAADAPVPQYHWEGNRPVEDPPLIPPPFKTELVGYFEYQPCDGGKPRLIPWDKEASPGYSDTYLDDAPWAHEIRARNAAKAARYAAIEARKAELRAQAKESFERDQQIDQRKFDEVISSVVAACTQEAVAPVWAAPNAGRYAINIQYPQPNVIVRTT